MSSCGKLNTRAAPGKRGSSQAFATDLITGNQALDSAIGAGGDAASAFIGLGGSPQGSSGFGVAGKNGSVNTLQISAGVFTVCNSTFRNVEISGNTASTTNSAVAGIIKT